MKLLATSSVFFSKRKQKKSVVLFFFLGVCVQVSLQLHTRVMKTKRSCEVKEGPDPFFNYKMTFKLKPQHLDEACLRFEMQQPNKSHSGLFLCFMEH